MAIYTQILVNENIFIIIYKVVWYKIKEIKIIFQCMKALKTSISKKIRK